MTNRIDQLERAGLVERTPDPSDRRGIQVTATQKGLDLWLTAFAAQAEKEKLFASTLDADEKRELNSLLRRMMITLERAAPGDPAC
jgi:DNA-binding MarR family transcriptional regulator